MTDDVLNFPKAPRPATEQETALLKMLAARSFPNEKVKREVHKRVLDIHRRAVVLRPQAFPMYSSGLRRLTPDEIREFEVEISQRVNEAAAAATVPFFSDLIDAIHQACTLEDELSRLRKRKGRT